MSKASLFHPVLFLVLCLIGAGPARLSAQSEAAAAFEQGNILYGEGEYEQALERYRTAASIADSSSLQLNLGNTCVQLGRFGEAILHYRRALAIDPGNADARANLRFAQRSAGLEPERLDSVGRLVHALSFNAWVWTATLSVWFTLGALLLPPFFSGHNIFSRLIALCALIVASVAGFSVLTAREGLKEAIVLAGETPLRVAPTSNSPAGASLSAGQPVIVEKEIRDFLHVRTAENQTGFLLSSEVGRIWAP